MPPHGFLRLILALWLALLAAPASAQQPALCRQGLTGTSKCVTPWDQAWIPSGISAAKIGAGTVNDIVFGYLVGATSPLQAQINAIVASIGTGTFAVTAGAGLSGGGSAALGGSVGIAMPNVGAAGTYSYPTQITTDAQGRVTSATPGSPPGATGSAVTLMLMGNGAALSSWVAGQYAGLGSIAGSSASPPGAWRAPAAGTVKNWFYTSSLANPSGAGRVVTVHKAAAASGGCGAYSPTAITITMPLAGQGASTATSLAVNAGDCILFVQNFTLNTGSGGSTIITAQYVPN